MKKATLHMIGNAHIDPVWLWQWPEGRQEVLATFRSALDRMNEYDDFCFTASSAAFYEWVEQADPAMFDEIRVRVAEGRWEIAGGWWIEPDCNLPGGESFARQALYAQRYFREKFGITARVGYNVDSFGHHAALPQLLKKSGLDYYVFMRPGPHEMGLPGRLFWWEADDGSRVLAFRIAFEYGSGPDDIEAHVRRCAGEIKAPLDEFLCFYGVGNHGGGPTIRNIEHIRRLAADPGLPRLAFSTTRRFFESVQARNGRLPVVHHDLQHHASGCYAAHSGVKRWNRRAENALLRAEKWAAVAGRAGSPGYAYPAELAHAWKTVLFNQFHDVLAGTSLEDAYEDAQNTYGEALAIADRTVHAAVQSIAWRLHVPVEDGVRPLLVFNPHAWPARLPVEMEVGGLQDGDGLATYGDGHGDGARTVPMQRVQSRATASGRSRIAFVAEVPPLGYRLFKIVPAAPAEPAPLQATPRSLENDRFRLTFDPDAGTLSGLYDKQAGVEVLAGPGARPVVLDDPGDTWGHNLFRFGPEVGAFRAERLRVTECGPVKAVLRVASTYGASRLVQDFTLYRDLDRIDVHVAVEWHEHFKALKLRFPLNVKHMKVTHEIPYGHIERSADGTEEVFQGWVDVSGTSRDREVDYGLSLLNDGKHSVDVNVRDIGLTVLRSPIYAHHIPVQPDAERDYAFIDQGVQHFTYSLYPHAGSWEQVATVRHAAELNQGPLALPAAFRPHGSLPPEGSFLAVDAGDVVVTALKKAEDGDDLIVRAYETAGRATRAAIRFPAWERTIDATFGPSEIKTFRLPADPALPAVEVNLIEDPLS